MKISIQKVFRFAIVGIPFGKIFYVNINFYDTVNQQKFTAK